MNTLEKYFSDSDNERKELLNSITTLSEELINLHKDLKRTYPNASFKTSELIYRERIDESDAEDRYYLEVTDNEIFIYKQTNYDYNDAELEFSKDWIYEHRYDCSTSQLKTILKFLQKLLTE